MGHLSRSPEILISISAAEPHPTKEHVTNRKESYALDNICDLAGALAAGVDHVPRLGRIRPHSTRHCDCGADYQFDPRPAAVVSWRQ